MTKCQSCGGTYAPVQTDGTTYFHRCSPLSRVELDAAVKGGKVVLPAGETVDEALARRTYERADLRDENVPSTAAADSGKLKAAGKGTAPAAAPPSPVVVVPA